MIRPIALAALLLTAGCTAQQAARVSSVVADAQQACVQVAPILTAAAVVADPKVQSILGYANAVCGPLAAGVAPPTVDGNTPQWLGQIAGMLKVLAPIALSLI